VVGTSNPGDTVNATLWNNGPKAITDFYTAPPLFRGRQTSIQTAPTATWWSVSMQASDIDTDSGHSNVTNNTRYTAQVAGWYWVEGFTAWAAAGAGARIDAVIAKNNSIVTGSRQSLMKPGSDFSGIAAAILVRLAVNDYVELWGQQTTGGNLNTVVAGDLCPCMNVFWVHS
jgi:hypothetical protein